MMSMIRKLYLFLLNALRKIQKSQNAWGWKGRLEASLPVGRLNGQLQDYIWLAIKGLQEGKFHNFTWQIVPMSNHLEGKKLPDIHAEVSVFHFVSIFYLVLSLGTYWKETDSIHLIWSFRYMDEIPFGHSLFQPEHP